MPLPGHAPKSGAISAVNAAATFSSVARQAKAAGINRDELREELGRLRNQPGAGAASAVVAASTGQRTSVEDGGVAKASKDEVTAALKEHWTKRQADSLFYRLYPQSASGTSEEDMDRWCRRVAARLAGEEEADGDEPVSDAVMSGAIAGMAMAEKQKEEEKQALTQTLLDLLPGGPPQAPAAAPLAAASAAAAAPPAAAAATPSAASASRPPPPGRSGDGPAAAAAEAAGQDLAKLSVRELKQRISATGAKLPPGLSEKSELVEFLRSALASAGAAPPPAEDAAGATVFL